MAAALGVLACLLAAGGGMDGPAAGGLDAPKMTLRLEGAMGRYVDAVVDQWLLAAPAANPGMVEMMRLRDRRPDYEDPVPWAGEFIGKFLTSAVLMRRLSDSPDLDAMVRGLTAEFIATQDADGYLGPFRRDERLLGHWDLWGHYHAMLAFHTWFRDTGDRAALDAALRAADLICATYLNTGRRVHDAGSAEMNMAVIHSLGLLYRETNKPEYLQMMREIEQDWTKPPAGDYLNAALAGVEFYQSPKPRWESLHPMLGLAELFRITGGGEYRTAMLHWWKSIRRYDVHNSGTFSTNEQAVGNPFMPGAIETCCTVAWIAYSVEALRLSGDPAVADALELAAWNAVPAYEHPSGRWCTYDTPMNGKRLASAHSIVFQSRPGTPELNCCSVNGPRGLAMLSEWALLEGGGGLCLNYYGPGVFDAVLKDGAKWRFTQQGDFPAPGTLRIQADPESPRKMPLFLRIPGWSKETAVRVNGAAVDGVTPGSYLRVDREWKAGDVIEITFDMTPRALRGDANVNWRSSLYQGPILLAYDQKYNEFDPADIPELDMKTLSLTPLADAPGRFKPMVLCRAAGADGHALTLVDFATAGAHGTNYQSWLPVKNAPPAPFHLTWPARGARLAPGDAVVEWSPAAKEGVLYDVVLAKDPDMREVLWKGEGIAETRVEPRADGLGPDASCYLQVTAHTPEGTVAAENGPLAFTIDPSLPPRTRGVVVDAPLRGDAEPREGALQKAEAVAPAPGPGGEKDGALRFDGKKSKVVYATPGFPLRNYTLSVWFRPERIDPAGKGWQEIVSAWYAGGNDPLRLAVTGGELVARIENPACTAQTPGVPLERGVWVHAAVVKQGAKLRLYVDGVERGALNVPETLVTDPANIGVGCNPNFGDLEGFQGNIARLLLRREALPAEDIARLAKEK